MSRVGKKPIKVPAGVKVTIDTDRVLVEGPKGKSSAPIPPGIKVEVSDGSLIARRSNDEKKQRSLHGLARSLIANTVEGVTNGFRKELDVVGIGFKAELRGKYLNLALGFSHPIEFPIPPGIEIKVSRLRRTVTNYVATVTIRGIDKGQVGQVAANIRALRPPDPYKGKGIRYALEMVRLKVGKKGA